MLTIFYVFATIGSFLFGGKLQNRSPEILHDDSIPDIYVINNFNDFATSFVTLFSLMVVNNWMVTTEMYVVIYGSKYIRFYFVIFYYLCVVIGLNIVIAFAIDMYNSIERLDKQHSDHEKKLYDLSIDLQ